MKFNNHNSPYGEIALVALLYVLFLPFNYSQTTYFVNTTDDVDDGACTVSHCSYREAINAANSDGKANVIQFKFLTGSSPFLIEPLTELPALTEDSLIINVTADHAPGDVILAGSKVSLNYGLAIRASYIEVYGFSITEFTQAGIGVLGLFTDIKEITIGTVSTPNFLFNNDKGIWMSSGTGKTLKDVAVQGNYIGTDNIQSFGVGNIGAGINMSGGGFFDNVLIGGDPTLSEGNILVQNGAYGINSAQNVSVRGNFIGIEPSTLASMPNLSHGVLLGSIDAHIFENTIAYNNGFGIYQNCGACIDNSLRENSVYCNVLGGISSSYPAPTILSTMPVVTGTALAGDSIELFFNTLNCVDCQGEQFVATTIADGAGDWMIDIGGSGTARFSATATNFSGHSSSFSSCIDVNDCDGAPYLVYSADACVSDFHFISTADAFPSGIPIASCTPDVGTFPSDVWLKALVPSSGALMVHVDTVNTEIDPLIEVYTGTCGALSLLKCDSLTTYPYVFPVAEVLPGSDVFFRIMDQGGDNFGPVGLAISEISADSSRWQVCEDKYDNRVANEFIVQFESGTSPTDVQAVVDELILEGGELIKSCDCSERVLQLWKEGSPIELEDRSRSARGKGNVDTTAYNFIIDERLCVTETQTPQVNIVNGPNGAFFITELITTYDTTDCSQSGIFNLCSNNPGYAPVSPDYSVVVAILDTGVDENNGSIMNAIWQNPEAMDTDNCKLNDQIGYDFINEDGTVEDLDGHGTGVNGVLACDYDQDIDLDLMNLKFFEDDRSSLFDAVCAIYYAIENGASVINISWGFVTAKDVPKMLIDAIEFARIKDVLVITSAGNRGLDNDIINKYPANIDADNVITVAAYEQMDPMSDPVLTSYSNFGDANVDLAALGQSKVPSLGGMTDMLAGTSLATPYVARTASEIRARYPMLSASEVKSCIVNSVDVFPDFIGMVKSNGILNHTAALDCAFNQSLLKCNVGPVIVQSSHLIDSLVLSQVSVSSGIKVISPLDIKYKAKQFIKLNPDFEVKAGAQFLAEIEDCSTIIEPH